MTAVTNTTPLHYLVLIGAVDVLPKLFSEIVTPQSVLSELLHPRAPAAARSWASQPPGWLKVLPPKNRLPSTARLGPGEADAISLAKEFRIREILIDDRAGRAAAAAEGLIILPTIAILERADELGLLDFATAIQALLLTNFHAPSDRIAAAISRVAARNGQAP